MKYNVKVWLSDPFIRCFFYILGDGKVTTGITGLWRLSGPSDVAFDPLMSALSIIVMRKLLRLGLFNHY